MLSRADLIYGFVWRCASTVWWCRASMQCQEAKGVYIAVEHTTSTFTLLLPLFKSDTTLSIMLNRRSLWQDGTRTKHHEATLPTCTAITRMNTFSSQKVQCTDNSCRDRLEIAPSPLTCRIKTERHAHANFVAKRCFANRIATSHVPPSAR